jgi:hypothetical protein
MEDWLKSIVEMQVRDDGVKNKVIVYIDRKFIRIHMFATQD